MFLNQNGQAVHISELLLGKRERGEERRESAFATAVVFQVSAGPVQGSVGSCVQKAKARG